MTKHTRTEKVVIGVLVGVIAASLVGLCVIVYWVGILTGWV